MDKCKIIFDLMTKENVSFSEFAQWYACHTGNREKLELEAIAAKRRECLKDELQAWSGDMEKFRFSDMNRKAYELARLEPCFSNLVYVYTDGVVSEVKRPGCELQGLRVSSDCTLWVNQPYLQRETLPQLISWSLKDTPYDVIGYADLLALNKFWLQIRPVWEKAGIKPVSTTVWVKSPLWPFLPPESKKKADYFEAFDFLSLQPHWPGINDPGYFILKYH